MKNIQFSIFLLIVSISYSFAQTQKKQTDEIQPKPTIESNNLFVIRVGGKHGYINKTGKIVIKSQFDYASDFSEGLAVVSIKDEANSDQGYTAHKSVYINEAGQIVISLERGAGDFSEGLATIAFAIPGYLPRGFHDTGGVNFGFIDKTGKIVMEPQFRDAKDFSEGLTAVMNSDRKWGFIDKTGKVVIPFQFEDAYSFSEGLACVLTRGLFGFIDKSGNVVIKPRFAVPSQFKEGLAAVRIPDGDFKPRKYYESYMLPEKSEMLFIDKDGNTAIKLESKVVEIDSFSEGLAIITVKESKENFYVKAIDKNGNLVFRLKFYAIVQPFSEGLARFQSEEDKFGFIDKTGKVVIKPKYLYVEDFRNGLAKVEIGKDITTQKLGYVPKSGYIDKTGKIIWQPTK